VPTTVLVDAWHLGGSSAQRGIGTYLREVLSRLALRDGMEVVGLATRGTTLPPGVRHRRIRRLAPDRWAKREHDLLLPLDLARAARRQEAQVVLSPADDPPSRSPAPWVQLLHDLIPIVVPDPAFAGDAARWRRVGGRLREAAGVITCSRHTADDAVRVLGVDRERITVAPLGVSPRFRPPAARRRSDPPTILYVGEYGPHKGFAEAFEVIAGLAEAGLPHRLRMVSFLAPWYEPVVRGLLERSPSAERVDLCGFVPDVVEAYQEADALVITSRYEGFCLPALEAMACGTPVVAFGNSAIPEVVGSGGRIVPDGDVDAMVRALEEVLGDRDAWEEASRRGVEQATRFTWERCVDTHAELFRALAGASA
jgi:glycosyltransferase involved in cell wall biosynthesis